MLSGSRRFVYVLRSVNHPDRTYVGVSADLESRLRAHNAGQNLSTIQWKPRIVEVCIEFRTEQLAVRFEKYLKTGSGHAFRSRHFVSVAAGCSKIA